MPTGRHGRERHLLRDKKAVIVNYHPFTIQLTKERSNEIQEVALGIDTGYENVGLSATTKDQVLFECKAELRTDLVENLSTRRETRRTRRSSRYEAELALLVFSAWKGLQLTPVPVQVSYPEDRVSHFRPLKDFMRITALNCILLVVALLYGWPRMLIGK